MNVVTLKAHYDGEKICLDEPLDIAPNTPLVIAIFRGEGETEERADWIALAKKGLARAYGDDEPDYPSDLVQEKPVE
ncbi:MAG: hypothetical protein FJ403_11415 [Verrucomicrobia bacterium]|nr:hypothetical protein [Verrucomicrobiota bacterium]